MVHDVSERKKTSYICNTEQCFDSALYRTIYHCIVIHQRQYIDTSTHCIVATLVCSHMHTLSKKLFSFIMCGDPGAK